MQLLDVAHPVEIDHLYVDLNILSEPSSYTRLGIDDLLQGCDYRKDFNRFGLPEKRERLAGLKAVAQYLKLIVLGKPGSGKTTFLQHIVIECNNGNLLADRVPVLIKLREFVEDVRETGDFSLGRYLGSCLRGCSQVEIETLLQAGKVLLLLDGLDEVPGADSNAAVRQIEKFVRDYDQNHLIITCRIQAQKYRFNRFAYVEVADFNSEQIAMFAQKWFVTNARNGEAGQARAEQFLEKLNLPANKQIRDLAVTPILLSLTCKVFDDKRMFYSKPAELYEQGLEILLSKWDESRGINRDQVYRDLSVRQKLSLLSHIAARKFEKEQYVLFEAIEIQGYIANYLGISSEDSKAVLESIEVQHGLFVERAQGIYSFSHLTFQEYFTAKWSCDRANWEDLVIHMIDTHWWEVFLLTVGMLPSTNYLLQLMKQQADCLLATDEKSQQLLMWASQKSRDVSICTPATARAFYLALALALALAPTRAVDGILARLGKDDTLILYLEGTFGLTLVRALDGAFNRLSDIDLSLDYALAYTLVLSFALTLSCVQDSVLKHELDNVLHRRLDSAINSALEPELQQLLQQLKAQVPSQGNSQRYEAWWKTNGQTWTEQLRAVMTEHRNIGHDWQFSNLETERLRQYYHANKLLVDCLNNDCVVSDGIRKEIEENLLLPIMEIERQQQER
jgi:predicted NACHT family NTPase